ncbi:DUF4142 domain-containing protein [Pedobacter yulinensis]|nr:DUF4142 domain-containing protein [Pedobacter yulinensis]
MEKIRSNRRNFLIQSSVAAVATALGVSTSSGRSFAAAPYTAQTNPKAFLGKIAPHIFLSMAACTIALKKATHPLVKKFTTFEMAETKALSDILREMGAGTPPMNARGEQVLKDLQTESGKAFDLRFLSAQAEAHAALEDLTVSFLKSPGEDKHAKHLAMATLPAIREHLDHCKMLLAEAAK